MAAGADRALIGGPTANKASEPLGRVVAGGARFFIGWIIPELANPVESVGRGRARPRLVALCHVRAAMLEWPCRACCHPRLASRLA